MQIGFTIKNYIVDENNDISKSNDCFETSIRSPLVQTDTTRLNNKNNNSSISDATTMHLAPPLNSDNINTDFNIPQHNSSDLGRNSVSRQSLIGKFRNNKKKLIIC
jgi:hypothetical protein